LKRLSRKRLSSGGYADAEESWTEEVRQALSAHIEEGYLHAERGELIDLPGNSGDERRLAFA
jgi:hypothetical protein